MKFMAVIKYMEGYLPTPRCRKLRFRECTEEVYTDIKEVSKNDAPVAFEVEGYEYRIYDNRLFSLSRDIMCCEREYEYLKGDIISQFKFIFEKCSTFYGFEEEDTREAMIEKLKNYSNSYIIMDGKVWEVNGEPRYLISVFGLGRNHGGTALSVTNHYNCNISSGAYFNAFERDKGIEKALKIAIGRGDTESIEGIKNCAEIKVLIPSMVKCNPLKDHCS